MLSFIGAHYVELVVLAMTLFAIGLFTVSVTDAFVVPQSDRRD